MSTHSFVRVDCKAFAKCGVNPFRIAVDIAVKIIIVRDVLLFVVNLEIESLMQVVER